MIRRFWRVTILLGLSVVTVPGVRAQEQPAEGPKEGEVVITGLLDFYFGWNARAPRAANGGPYFPVGTPSGETLSGDNFGLFFNYKDRKPTFTLGEVDITRTAGKGFPLGVRATLTFGESARLFHATEPGGTSSWQTLHNLYLTRSFKAGQKEIVVDFGKFASPFGVEVLESPANDNYSRAFTFWYGVPFYHLGLRATTQLHRNVTLQAGLVNGWNNVADDNDAKTLYTQFVIKPNPRYTQTISWIGGLEGTGAYGPIAPTNGGGGVTTNLLDLTSSYQITPNLKLGGWVAYGSADGHIQGVGRITGNWLGLVGYVRYQATPEVAVAARVEQFEDFARTGGFGPRFQLPGYLKMREYTLTLEYVWLKGQAVTRLEYRHDQSNQAVFGTASGAGTFDQDTLYLSQAFRF
ncbi:MAG: outer membrane beta-barrel protein [Chloroherpetonaceae bacterium]|nr:outer membrane beta-barrel protein [Chloroherpetonaceae bacterium]